MRNQYQVALSFAGEERSYVEGVAQALRSRGIRVFYDDFEKVDLWGNHMVEFFEDLFANNAQCVVMFISAGYVEKAWPRHERRSALSRAVREGGSYVLPVRFDATPVPGLSDDVYYLDANDHSPVQIAGMIEEKLKNRSDDSWSGDLRVVESDHVRSGLSSEAMELLSTASNDLDRMVVKQRRMGGQFIRTNRRSFGEMGNAREEALWEAALQELVDAALVEDKRGGGKVFYVTHKGFQIADQLSAARD